eukprot:Opistho-2@80056
MARFTCGIVTHCRRSSKGVPSVSIRAFHKSLIVPHDIFVMQTRQQFHLTSDLPGHLLVLKIQPDLFHRVQSQVETIPHLEHLAKPAPTQEGNFLKICPVARHRRRGRDFRLRLGVTVASHMRYLCNNGPTLALSTEKRGIITVIALQRIIKGGRVEHASRDGFFEKGHLKHFWRARSVSHPLETRNDDIPQSSRETAGNGWRAAMATASAASDDRWNVRRAEAKIEEQTPKCPHIALHCRLAAPPMPTGLRCTPHIVQLRQRFVTTPHAPRVSTSCGSSAPTLDSPAHKKALEANTSVIVYQGTRRVKVTVRDILIVQVCKRETNTFSEMTDSGNF